MLTLGNKLTLNSQPIYHFVNEHSVDFDGVDDCIVTDGADTVAQPTTYSFWCKSSVTAANRGVFGHGYENLGGFHFNYDGTRPLLYLGSSFFVYWNDTSAQDDGEWHHWVVYSDTNNLNNCKLYVDGVLQTVSFINSSGSLSSYTESLTIGSDQASGGNSFEGKIDEFAVYDRELTQAEITRMFNTYYSPNRVANGNFAQIGNEEVTNGDFSQIGSELVTNGDFATDSDWGFVGDGSISNGQLILPCCISNNRTSQSISMSSSKSYKLEINITQITSGDTIDYLQGGAWYTFGTQLGINTAYITNPSDANLYLRNSNGVGTIKIDNVSVKEVGQDWTILGTDATNTVNFEANGVRFISVDQNISISQFNALTVGKIYKLTCDVVTTTGAIGVDGAITEEGTISMTNGSNEIYFTASATTFKIKRVIAVTNCLLSNVSVKEVGQHWTFGTGWGMGDGITNANVTSTAGLTQSLTGLTIGASYKLTLTISNYVTGSLQPQFGGVLASPTSASSNGTHTFDIIPTGTTHTLYLYALNTSQFSVDNIVVQELKHDATNLMLNAGAYQSANPLITSTKSMEFDGTDDYLSIGSDCPTGNFTVTSWVKKTGTGGWYAIFSASTQIWFGLNDNGRILAHVGSPSFSATGVVDINKWHNCTLTWNGTASFIYVDGVQVATSTGTSNPAATPYDIGKLSTSGQNYFDGLITEVGLYDRALTSLEVASLYNQGMPTNLLVNRNNYQSGNPTVFNTKQVDFDGVDDRLVANSTLGSFTGTFSFWINRDNNTGYQYLFDSRESSGAGRVYMDTGSDNIVVSSGTSYVDGVAATVVPTDGNWHNVIITGITLDIVNSIIFGSDYGGGNSFNGKMSQIGLWNSTLTADEVSSLYNHGLPIDLTTNQAAYESSSNLVGYWRMGSGTLDSYPLIADQTNATLSAEYVKNGDFSQIGSEQVTNTDFSDNSEWQISNTFGTTGWTILNGQAIQSTLGASNGRNLQPSTSTGSLVSGKVYKVVIDFAQATENGMRIGELGGAFADFEIIPTGTIGVYTYYRVATFSGRLNIHGGTNTQQVINNVSVKEVLQDWSFTGAASGYQTYTGSGIKMYSGSVSDAQNALSTSETLNLSGTLGKVYKMDITASDFVNGSMGFVRLDSVYDASNIIYFQTGTQTVYFTAYQDFTFIRFFAGSSNAFITVNSISIKEVGGSPAIMTNQTSSDIENGSPYANLVQNGTFDTTDYWTFAGTNGEVSGGYGVFPDTTNSYIIQSSVVEASVKNYTLQYEVIESNGGSGFGLSGGSSAFGSVSLTNSVGVHTKFITSNGSQTNLQFNNGSNFIGKIDNVTLAETNTGLQGYWKMGDGTNDEYPVIYDQVDPTLSAELVTNGDFSAGSTGWENAFGGEWVISGGKATLAVGADGSYLRTVSNILTSGKSYKAVITTSGGLDSNNKVTIYATSNTNQKAESDGTHTFYFTADNTSFRFLGVANDRPISIDSVSVKEIQGNPATMTNMVEGNITNQFPLTKIRNYYRMGDGILDGYPIIQDQTSPNLAHIPTTNMVPNSNTFNVINSATATPNYGISPDGTQNSVRIQTSGNNSGVLESLSNTLTDTDFTYSVFLKGVAGETIDVRIETSPYSLLSQIQHTFSGEWERVEKTVSASITHTTKQYYITHIGAATATDFQIFGMQVEQQSQATAYLKTDGIAAVRKSSTTNLISYSEDFSTYDQVQDITLTANATTSPTGTSNATKFTSSAASGSKVRDNISVVSGTTYTFSVYCKNIDATLIKLLGYDGVTSFNKVVTSEVSTTEWTRVSLTFTAGNTTSSGQVQIARDLPSGESAFFWGAQFEAQTQAETYAKTTGLPVKIDLFTENNYGTMTNMSASDIVEDTP
jgi:hypothetical protein